jgi:hypothetical protein
MGQDSLIDRIDHSSADLSEPDEESSRSEYEPVIRGSQVRLKVLQLSQKLFFQHNSFA